MKNTIVPRLDAVLRFLTIALSMIAINVATVYAHEAGASSSATPAPKPSGMSERELYLLNEIELLKSRLAELESHVASGPVKAAAPAVTATQALQPAEVAVAPMSTSSSSAATAAPSQNASKAEPFAFADFSWLTGNSRTKES